MLTKIRKWGNSLGLRIPKSFAKEACMKEGSTVDISVRGGRLQIRLVLPETYDLGELLARVTRTNRHGEVSTGDPVGREVW